MLRLLGLLLLGAGAVYALRGSSASAAEQPGQGPEVNQGDIVSLARQIAAAGGQDPALVLAIIEVESSFNPRAYRAEPQINDASRGLMQLLLSTARDRGYPGDEEGLFDPETNIRLGVMQLAWINGYLASRLGRPPQLREVLTGYNMGVGAAMRGKVALSYSNKVNNALARWR